MYRLYPDFLAGRAAIGLLFLRVVVGTALMLHGWSKIQHPFSWMDKMPNPAPAPLQALAAISEFGGGLALLLGLLTPIAMLGVMSTMIGAFLIRHRNDPWVNPGGRSFELPSLYLAMAIMFIIVGPGIYSLDAMLFGKKRSGSRSMFK